MKSWPIIIFLLVISCGKAPLFAPLEKTTITHTNALSSNDVEIWPDHRTHFAIQWKSRPTSTAEAQFIIKFWDSYHTNFFGPYDHLLNRLCLFLWMKMPDGSEHGSSPITLTTLDDHYQASDLYFIMPGLWQIRLRTVESSSHCTGLKSDPYLEEKILEIFIP
jgi:hypothetical protein